MKSKVQTYDMRDSEEFKGVLEIEVLIESDKQAKEIQSKITSKLESLFKQDDKNDRQTISGLLANNIMAQFT